MIITFLTFEALANPFTIPPCLRYKFGDFARAFYFKVLLMDFGDTKGIWIPIEVWKLEELTLQEKHKLDFGDFKCTKK